MQEEQKKKYRLNIAEIGPGGQIAEIKKKKMIEKLFISFPDFNIIFEI